MDPEQDRLGRPGPKGECLTLGHPEMMFNSLNCCFKLFPLGDFQGPRAYDFQGF